MATARRPHCHLAPPTGWINDPNGLVHFRGEWHCFYQFYDPQQVDGMQWGHAVSHDLLHWSHLPPALRPDRHGQIWSGSAVVDHHGSSGLLGDGAGIVCLFTYWDHRDGSQCQGLAYSRDGRSFEVLDEPIIPRLSGEAVNVGFRDPKVFRHEPSGRWVMAVAGGKLRIYTSTNLRDWTLSDVHDDLVTECPDLFPLGVDDDPQRELWVLSGAGRWYQTGRFDGERFTPVSERRAMGHGPDWYATQTWSDAPDGRRIGLSWLYGWDYDSQLGADGIRHMLPTPWAGNCLSLPYEIGLRSSPDGPRLFQRPVAECESLRRPDDADAPRRAAPGETLTLPDVRDHALEVLCRAPRSSSWHLCMDGHAGTTLRCGVDAGAAFLERRGTPELPRSFTCDRRVVLDASAEASLRVIVDRTSVEIIVNGGAQLFSACFLPAGTPRIEANADALEVRIHRLSPCVE